MTRHNRRKTDTEPPKAGENVVDLNVERVVRRDRFPEALDVDEQVEIVLEYIRQCEWATDKLRTDRRDTPQGRSLIHEPFGASTSCVHSVAFVLGLELIACEDDSDVGRANFWFQPSPSDACQTSIRLRVECDRNGFRAYYETRNLPARLAENPAPGLSNELEGFLANRPLAVWETWIGNMRMLNILWSDGSSPTMVQTDDDTIMYVPGNQLPDFPDFIPDALALAVSART